MTIELIEEYPLPLALKNISMGSSYKPLQEIETSNRFYDDMI
jgi:hypothetical protein